MKFSREFVRDGETVAVQVESLEGDRYRVRVGDKTYEYDARVRADGGVRLQRFDSDGASGSDASGSNASGTGGPNAGSVAYGAGSQQAYMVRVDGYTHTLKAPSGRRGGGVGSAADGSVRAPMTGTVLDVMCQVGDQVEADQTLVVVSAMKMEHKLCAGIAGVVQSVAVLKEATVEQGDELVVVAAAADGDEGVK